MFDKLWESPWFSDEGDTVGLCPPDNHWLVGLRCRGRDCDDQQILCRKIVPADWNESPASVGRWVQIDTLQYAGQDIKIAVKRCVETERETVATREERNLFATETGVSLSIEKKSGCHCF
jgi:hypothetical protein